MRQQSAAGFRSKCADHAQPPRRLGEVDACPDGLHLCRVAIRRLLVEELANRVRFGQIQGRQLGTAAEMDICDLIFARVGRSPERRRLLAKGPASRSGGASLDEPSGATVACFRGTRNQAPLLAGWGRSLQSAYDHNTTHRQGCVTSPRAAVRSLGRGTSGPRGENTTFQLALAGELMPVTQGEAHLIACGLARARRDGLRWRPGWTSARRRAGGRVIGISQLHRTGQDAPQQCVPKVELTLHHLS